MKKTLVALAALSAAGAFAQSSVTMYGVVDTTLTRITGSVASVTGQTSGNWAASRLGFRGVEDLGGGLKANFNLEAGISVDNGTGAATSTDNVNSAASTGLTFNRIATVGLVGSFGEFQFGRRNVPSFYNDDRNPFGTNSVGDDVHWQANLIGQAQQRTSNGFHYFTPELGGFFAHLHYALGEQPSNATFGTDKNGNYAGLLLGYRSGPLDVALGYGKQDIKRGNATASNNADRSVTNLGASYDFGVVKLNGEYSQQTLKNTVNIGAGLTTPSASPFGVATAGVDTKAKAYSLSATAPVGPGLVKLAYSTVKIDNGLGVGTEPKASKFAVGYVYSFSKRTSIYTTVARLSNKNNAALTAGTRTGLAGASTAANESSNGYEIGLRHNF